MSETTKVDPMRITLQRMLKQSKSSLTHEDVLREFRVTKDKCDKGKLLNILRDISQHHQEAHIYLEEAEKNLQKKDSFYCLIIFLSHFSNEIIMHSIRKKDMSSTSTPLISKTLNNSNCSDNVAEIKERVTQAAQHNLYRTTASVPMPAETPKLMPAQLNGRKFMPINKDFSSTSWDICSVNEYSFQEQNISAIPLVSQEYYLLHDLIYCFTGMNGCYIRIEDASDMELTHFKISDQIDCSLKDIAIDVLPLATYYIYVQRYVDEINFCECGQILQALCEALRTLISDYFLLLSQLETELSNGNLTVHKLLFYVRPTLNTMEVIAGVLQNIVYNGLKGGKVLTLLYNKINSLTGDSDAQKFLIHLTQSASVPYMHILQLWMQKGVINDPQNEFLVEDNEVIRREELPEHYSADYWEKRYTIRRERIPCFLEKVADIIMRTGKYLNVMRQCGKELSTAQVMQLKFSPNNQNHIAVIRAAYSYSSKKLLEVLLKENDLMGHLLSVKRYLLLHQGDFISQFMDACEEELSKNVDSIVPMTLENLLGLTLRLSSAKHDPYKDDVHCELLTYDLVTQLSKIMNQEEDYWHQCDRLDLTGLECFAFRYDVKWPISLVLNHIAISKYQMLFRQLFFCKHVERQLCKIWKENSIAKKFSPHAASLYRCAFTLRQRMMNAIQNLLYYMMIEVIEPNWHIFYENMTKVENVDEVLNFHEDFLDSCLKNCMLTDTTVLNRSVFKLCNVCLKFCDFIQKSQRLFCDAELTSMIHDSTDEENSDSDNFANQKQSEMSLTPSDTFSERVERFDLEFTGILINILKLITIVASDNPSDRFISLVHRINFNSYYNDQMDNLCTKMVFQFDKCSSKPQSSIPDE